MTSQEKDFGLLIAYILPGFIALLGYADRSETIQLWLGQTADQSPTIGGFLFLTVAAIFVGMTLSTVRWLVLDSLHAKTGIRQPNWDFSRLGSRESGFNLLLNIHYRYYQFYSNSMVAVAVYFIGDTMTNGFRWPLAIGWLAITIFFYLGSRDTLKKYYVRVNGLLSS